MAKERCSSDNNYEIQHHVYNDESPHLNDTKICLFHVERLVGDAVIDLVVH